MADPRAEAQRVLEAAEQEELLTVKQYADIFGLHEQTVYTAIRFGRHLNGRVERPTSHTIRIAVPRESIARLKSA